MLQHHQQQHHQHVGGSNKNLLSAMSPLLACRSGRPVDPDVVPLMVEKKLSNDHCRQKQGLSGILGSARKQRKSMSSSAGKHPEHIDTTTPTSNNLIQINGVVQVCSSHKKSQKSKGNDNGDRVRNHWVSRKGSTSPLSWDQYFQSQWSNFNPDNPIFKTISQTSSSWSGTANLSSISTSTSTADGNGTQNDTVNDSDWFRQDHDYQRQLMCGRNVTRARLPQDATATTSTSTGSALPLNSFQRHSQPCRRQQQLQKSTKDSPQHNISSAMTPKTSTLLTTRGNSILPAPSLTETISTSLSSGDEVSCLSFHHDDDAYYNLPPTSSSNTKHSISKDIIPHDNPAIKTPLRSRANTNSTAASSSLSSRSSFSQRQSNKTGSQELKFWRTQASHCFDQYGIDHVQTATAFLELGMAHVRCEQYTAAQDFFRTAHGVFERKFGPKDLRVAKTLEQLGGAQSNGHFYASNGHENHNTPTINEDENNSCSSSTRPKAGLLLGLQSLRKAFRIRFDVMGPTHIDTVETVNKIAGIYMKLGMYSSAKTDYFEVLTLRTAILGNTHPSVAVAAQSLGMAHLKMNEEEQAKAYFLQALNVFALAGLGDHPIAAKLRDTVEKIGFDLARMEI